MPYQEDLLLGEIGQVEIGLLVRRNRTGNNQLQKVVLFLPVLFRVSPISPSTTDASYALLMRRMHTRSTIMYSRTRLPKVNEEVHPRTPQQETGLIRM
jgi:hypothetical protein